MYKYIKIKNYKAIKISNLEILKKINILCGKNNSGKTSLLEAINSDEHMSIGIDITEDEIDILFNNSNSGHGWADNRGATGYRKLLNEVLPIPKIIYSDEIKSYTDTIGKNVPKYIGNYVFNGHIVENGFKTLYQAKEKTILIPPKRNLDFGVVVNPKQDINEEGKGIINHLFYCKNQQEHSGEFKYFKKLNEGFKNITGGYEFEVFIEKDNHLVLRFKSLYGQWIKANDCGLGLQDVLVILYFSLNINYSLILIEEPEAHIHPEMQRRLLSFLRSETDKQFIISTHSNVFLDNAFVDRVYFLTCVDNVNVEDATSRAFILDDLGYSVADNLISDLVILVEGPSDVPIIEEFFKKNGYFKEIQYKNMAAWW